MPDKPPMTVEFLEETGVGWDGKKIYRSKLDSLWKYRDKKGNEHNVPYVPLANGMAIIEGMITKDRKYL